MARLFGSIAHSISRQDYSCFLQSSFAECGLACLGMISAAHGLQLSLRELRGRFPISLQGTTLRRLLQIAEQLNLAARGVQLDLQEIENLRLPAILHWDMNHFVVLMRVSRGRAIIFDPAIGRRTLALTEMSTHFTGVALEVWPGLGFKREKRQEPLLLRDLMGAISGLFPALGNVLLLSLILNAAGLLAPLQLQLIIDEAVPQQDMDLAILVVIGFAALQLFSVCGSLLRRFLLLRLSQSVTFAMQGNIVRHLMALPLRFFQSRHIGDLLSKLESAGAVQGFLLSGALSTLIDGLVAAAALALLFTYGAGLALLCCVLIAAQQLLDLALVGLRRQISHEQVLASSREHTLIVEMLSGVQALKLSGRASNRIAVWEAAFSKSLSRQSQQETLSIWSDSAQGVISIALNALLLYLLIHAVLGEDMTVGMMMSFLAYKAYLSGALSSLAGTLIGYRMLAVPLERLADIVLAPAEPQRGAEADLGDGSIEFRDVWFRYDEGLPFILRGLSFRIEPGQHVAIAGASGCGKSTLLKLLTRIETPERGEILVGGRPLASLDLQSYREHLGVVMQDDQLFTGSLLENISMFADTVDEMRLNRACALACLTPVIGSMPMGLMSMVGDMGSALSGGQKQRVMLARALYREPKILLMDEATSHLDPETERSLTKHISRLSCTRLTIAHRRETLEEAGRVLELKQGVLI